MGSPNNKLLKPENGKLTLFKKSVAVCTSAAIAAVFLQCLPPKMHSYAEAVTGETTNGFKYSIEGTKVAITGWTGDKETVTSLTIPATVNGQAVTHIGSGAFEKYPKLTSISIPETVTELGWGAFASSGLTSVTLPAGIQKLSYCVFSECKDLKELTLPKDFPEDGKIDAKDASQILVYYSKMSTGAEGSFSDTQKSAANVNNDDKIDAKDSSFILAYYAMASTATDDVPTMAEYMAARAS